MKLNTYASILAHCVNGVELNWMLTPFATLRKEAHRIMDAPSNPVKLVKSTIPVIRLKTMITHWMASPAHSLAIKHTNDITCGILNGAIIPPEDIHGPMWSTELWALTALSAMPKYPTSLPIVYLHVMVHVDDYEPYGRNGDVTHTVVAISLGEFDSGQGRTVRIPFSFHIRSSGRRQILWE